MQHFLKKKKKKKYYWNTLPDDQEYVSNYDTRLAVKMFSWCSNCGKNHTDL